MKRLALTLLALSLAAPALRADDDTNLTRDEVATIKKRLKAVELALGLPAPGYAKPKENFSLPTDFSKDGDGKLNPNSASVSLRYESAGEKEAKKTQDDLGAEYQKKMAEAMAKGDYASMQAMGQEMQQKAGQAQVKAIDSKKEPIDISVNLNSFGGEGIDPDKVVFEKPGVLALKGDADDAGKENVAVYFDAAALKDTKKLSKVDLQAPKGGVKTHTGVCTVRIDLRGPSADVEAWAKRIDTKTVLAQTSADGSN